MRNLFLALFLLCAVPFFAQDTTAAVPIRASGSPPKKAEILMMRCGVQQDSLKLVTAPQVGPVFPGDSMNAYLMHRMEKARVDSGCAPPKMYVSFVVLADGSIVNVTMKTTRGVCTEFNLALVDAFCSMPKWKPGMNEGKPCNTRMVVPVYCNLLFEH